VHFYADDDRAAARHEKGVGAKLTWGPVAVRQQAFEVAGGWDRWLEGDHKSEQDSYYLGVSWFSSAAGLLANLPPGRIDFKQLRPEVQ